jgi:hypothetical protein
VTKTHDGVKPNIGVVPGPSGYVVQAVGPGPELTVKAPGRRDGWAWYSLPEPRIGIPDPVLVPPSTIRGKPFEIIGQTSPAPAWLLERITQS